tara:strand:+ start:1892 stop:3115 length:1224 start_codon:yes stop_codon:yes gene_type:complete
MADNIVAGLFGLSPEMYGEQQRRSSLNEGIALAQLDPAARGAAMTYAGARGLGGALAGSMGIEDPQLKLISARNTIAQQIDQTNPESVMKGAQMLAQMGDQQGAFALADLARKAQSEMALTQQRRAAEQASLATTAKTQLGIDQENKLRTELSALGPNATQDQILAVLTKYGSPDKVLSALQVSADKAAQREQALQMQKDKIAADIEKARQSGADKKELAEMRIQGQKDLAIFAQSLKGPKALAPSLQKEEDKELELVDSLKAREDSLAPAIASLTPDPKTGKIPLELGPINNLRYQAQNAAGNSTPESSRFAELERAVQSATNLKTDAAKGVQTDKDVLRFANELIAAYGKYDTKVTKQALEDFVKSTAKAKENAQKRIDSRRKSQGVEPYYGPGRGTAQNPIKLD